MVRKRRRRRAPVEHENEERWLLTYADMITLLMALFMVLFSISSVNVSKVKSLQASLKQAFSAHVLPGGESIMQSGGSNNVPKPAPEPPSAVQSVTVHQQVARNAQAALREQQDFERLKRSIDAQARREGVASKVSTRITQRGLAIHILTDNLLFDSGQARIKPPGLAVLTRLAPLLQRDNVHRIIVEGHTDSVPIRGGQYPSNWELSTARASAVVRALVANHLTPGRFEATGRNQFDPVASNATASGRMHNRRVDIVLPREGVTGGIS